MDQKYLLTFMRYGVCSYAWFESEEELIKYANNLKNSGHGINEALYLPTATEIEF